MTEKELIMKANSGDVDARLELAENYFNSDSPQDNDKAFEMYSGLMTDDIIGGFIGVADCYRYGVGVKKSFPKAVKLYSMLYKEGNLMGIAQYEYATCLWFGFGTKTNKLLAFALFYELAVDGHAGSQLSVARMYNWGEGIASNVDKACLWYKKSAEQGDETAIKELGELKVRFPGLED